MGEKVIGNYGKRYVKVYQARRKSLYEVAHTTLHGARLESHEPDVTSHVGCHESHAIYVSCHTPLLRNYKLHIKRHVATLAVQSAVCGAPGLSDEENVAIGVVARVLARACRWETGTSK